MKSTAITLATIAVLLAAGEARAQTATWGGRARVSVNGGVQPLSISFSGSTTDLVDLETAVTTAEYKVASGPTFDLGVAIRLVRNLGVGIAISSFASKHDATVSATIPHPFFFNTPRSITGTGSSLRRSELAAHVQAIYVIAIGRRLDVAVMAGPSFFNTKQDVVSEVAYAESYPYDTAAFVSASTSRVSKSGVGFNAGADVAVRLAQHVGVGVLVRFSRASLEYAVPSRDEAVKSDAGGAQVGGGVRFFF